MPSIIVVHHKRSPKVKDFLRDCDQIMRMKGFQIISQNPSTYYNIAPNVTLQDINALIKLIQAIQSYSQAVQSIYCANNMKKV